MTTIDVISMEGSLVVNETGRILIPKPIREALGIECSTVIKFRLEGRLGDNKIVLFANKNQEETKGENNHE